MGYEMHVDRIEISPPKRGAFHVLIRSGGDEILLAIPLDEFRTASASANALLGEWDAQCRVIPMPKRKGAH